MGVKPKPPRATTGHNTIDCVFLDEVRFNADNAGTSCHCPHKTLNMSTPVNCGQYAGWKLTKNASQKAHAVQGSCSWAAVQSSCSWHHSRGPPPTQNVWPQQPRQDAPSLENILTQADADLPATSDTASPGLCSSHACMSCVSLPSGAPASQKPFPQH
jgi:hypothetical protein